MGRKIILLHIKIPELINLLIILVIAFSEVAASGRPEFPEDMKEIIKFVHNTCVDKTGVSENDITNCEHGIFPENPKLKCYMYCLMEEASFVEDDGTVDYDMLISMIPDEWREQVGSMINACRHLDTPEKEGCQKAFDVHKCLYEKNPGLYFLF